MAYVKTNWVAGVTPLSEGNMDHLETQWDEAHSTFTELFSASHQAGGADAWEDWDLSAIIGVGSQAALIMIQNVPVSGNVYTGGVRKNGSALERKVLLGAGHAQDYTAVVILTPVDTNRILEIFCSTDVTKLIFYCIGYWS